MKEDSLWCQEAMRANVFGINENNYILVSLVLCVFRGDVGGGAIGLLIWDIKENVIIIYKNYFVFI